MGHCQCPLNLNLPTPQFSQGFKNRPRTIPESLRGANKASNQGSVRPYDWRVKFVSETLDPAPIMSQVWDETVLVHHPVSYPDLELDPVLAITTLLAACGHLEPRHMLPLNIDTTRSASFRIEFQTANPSFAGRGHAKARSVQRQPNDHPILEGEPTRSQQYTSRKPPDRGSHVDFRAPPLPKSPNLVCQGALGTIQMARHLRERSRTSKYSTG